MTMYKVTCLDDTQEDGKPGVRIDASSKRWESQQEAEKYAAAIAKSRKAKVVKVPEREEAIAHLRDMIKPGDTVYTVLRHVSRSGMTRGIDVYFMPRVADDKQCEPVWITAYVGHAIGSPQPRDYWDKSLGLKIGGCGMDMGWHLVYTLSRVLFPQLDCIGDGCPSNDHHNGDRNYKPHRHTDGGYALRQKWL